MKNKSKINVQNTHARFTPIKPAQKKIIVPNAEWKWFLRTALKLIQVLRTRAVKKCRRGTPEFFLTLHIPFSPSIPMGFNIFL